MRDPQTADRGRRDAKRHTRSGIAAFVVVLIALATPSPSSAAPFHARAKSLDITGLNHACGVATDSKGDLYASSAGALPGEWKIKVYDASHALLTEIEDTHEPCGLAVGSKEGTNAGYLYVSEKATGEVVRFKPNAYPFAGTPTYGAREVIDASTKAKGIAVDRFDNALYVAEGTRVSVYDSAGSLANVNEAQKVLLSSTTGGTFKLEFESQKTAAIAFNASAETVQTALTGLSTIGAGNVSVAKPKEKEYLVTFLGALANTDVEALVGDPSGLTGSTPKVNITEEVKGFSGHIGEGTLSEASGLAIYSYPNEAGAGRIDRYLWVADASGADHLDLFAGTDVKTLAPRRELDGKTTPDGSFGFGAAGAYLAADPGNRNSKGECKVVGEPQACTAGHLFLYDAAHAALDEFDASGEYLDQTKNAAFADAEPSAIALERSGTSGDGTLYVTAGSGAGAKALAFGPLKAPSRAVSGLPPSGLSHILPNAQAIATDSHGDVYVAAGAFIRIYGTAGEEITSIEDVHNPGDLAVDSAGNVYVLDNNTFSSEAEVTYYAPSEYPPQVGTTYERHEPLIATAADFPKEILKAIAIDPGSEEGKDRLFVTANASAHEYDTAENGSGLLNGEFGQCAIGSIRESIAVDGVRGIVYIAGNLRFVYAVSEASGECLARFENTGPASAAVGANPLVAVDQSNGHVIEYDAGTGGAREYDAAAGFVAEFGAFTASTRLYRVAIDNACAIHTDEAGEPEPLDETTTPTCKAFDPANGTAYVAYDDPNASHPPYDVSAFGSLSYPTPLVEPEEFKLTVKTAGTGSGTVTATGIACPGDCTEVYEKGTKVPLTQSATAGSKFAGWSGACSGTAPCEVTISETKEVTATFNTEAASERTLTIAKAGSGDGTFECKTTGSFGACASTYSDGETITIKATPNVHSTFTGWAGCSSSAGNECTVSSIAANTTVTATFTAIPRTLTIAKAGSGDGTFECKTTGSFGACASTYSDGETITIKATPNVHSTFTGWAGCSSSAGNECTVSSIAANTTVTATFTAIPRTLTIAKAGSGDGTFECKTTGSFGACASTYSDGETITIKATPNVHSTFTGWAGCSSSAGNECTVSSIAANTTVTATFTAIPRTLTIAKAGSGDGTFECKTTGSFGACASTYSDGETITIKATPNVHSTFTGWAGCSSSAGNECTVSSIAANTTVTATFTAIPRTLTIAKAGSGDGTFECKTTGSFGACASTYSDGETITIKATPNVHSTFTGWAGCSSSAGNECTVSSIAANTTVTATFTAIPRTLTIAKAGSGDGTFECKTTGSFGACASTYSDGETITIKATPNVHSTFTSWAGCSSSAGNECTVSSIAANTTVTATFTAIPRTLTIAKAGSGDGTFECKTTGSFGACASTYSDGETITIKATPNVHSTFTGWAGCSSSAGNECTVSSIAANTTVTATFTAIPRTLTIAKAGSGDGTFECKTTGSFGACASTYSDGETITIKATPNVHSTFTGWAGCSSSAGNECTVSSIAANTTVTATFTAIPRTLTIAKAGSGDGTFECKTTGSFGACASTYSDGETITIKATPNVHSTFTGWAGCSSSAGNECTVSSIAANTTVTATFTAIPRTLTIAKAGSGDGTFECKTTGSFGACASTYSDGETITIKATPNVHSTFTGWAGCSSSAGNECTVSSIAANTTVTATFSLESTGPTNRRLLTITKSANGPGGLGTVSSKPKGIKCAANCSQALARMFKNTPVTLTEKPGKNSAFVKWNNIEPGGPCDETTAATCEVPMAEDESLEAVFALISEAITEKTLNPAEPLTLSKGEGSGFGTVKAAGLGCEAECSETTVLYQGPIGGLHSKDGKTVFLTAAPAFGSSFTGWSGDCKSEPVVEGKGTECEVEMSAAKSVTATFTALATKTLTINKPYSSGNGSVSSKPKGIKCAATCTQAVAQMPAGASVELTAKPGTETTFVHWVGGDCNGETTLTCTVSMNTDETIEAVFSKPGKAIAEAKTLTLTKAGSGFGTVKASGLTCEALCTLTAVLYQGPVGIKAGKDVTLKATSAPGSKTVLWGGSPCKSNPTPGECVVEMSEAKNVTVTFEELE